MTERPNMPDQSQIEKTIKELLVERLFLQIKPDEIASDAPLMETLGIDSIQIFEIVVGLEETYAQYEINFQDDEFNIETFATVNTIVDYVTGKIQEYEGGKQEQGPTS